MVDQPLRVVVELDALSRGDCLSLVDERRDERAQIGALTGLTHGRVCEDPALRALVSALVDEGKAVAAAQGIELDADPEELVDHAARPDVAYDHKASMLQDVEARRPTEIDYLNGGIVRFGDEHGVPTPHNRAIWALVRGLERSW